MFHELQFSALLQVEWGISDCTRFTAEEGIPNSYWTQNTMGLKAGHVLV
jgi:hypothetical protein